MIACTYTVLANDLNKDNLYIKPFSPERIDPKICIHSYIVATLYFHGNICCIDRDKFSLFVTNLESLEDIKQSYHAPLITETEALDYIVNEIMRQLE